MSSPGEEVAAGAAGAVIEFTVERIPELIKRFQNKEIAFIKDRENINTVKQERNSAEWKMIGPFVPKEERVIGIQIQMGLALRSLESHPERLEDLRQKIVTRFGTSALRIAELAQRGIVAELLTRLAKIHSSPGEVQSRFISFLKVSEDFAFFIKSVDIASITARTLKIRLEGAGSSHCHCLRSGWRQAGHKPNNRKHSN